MVEFKSKEKDFAGLELLFLSCQFNAEKIIDFS